MSIVRRMIGERGTLRARSRRRLDRRDRRLLVAVVLMATPAIVVSTIYDPAFPFGPGFPFSVGSSRYDAIIDHARRAAVWAVLTPVCAWLLLKVRRWG